MFSTPLIASVLGMLFYVFSLLVHVLVIKKCISFKLVNGGRSESYEKQKELSFKSIPILIIGFAFISLSMLLPSVRETLMFSIVAFIFTALWGLGFIMQLLGSKFEKLVMSPLLFVGVISHLQLALIYFMR